MAILIIDWAGAAAALIAPPPEEAMTIKKRVDEGLDRIAKLGAKAVRIVLTEADLEELGVAADVAGGYRGVPVSEGQIGGHSYIETQGAPSGDTNFAI